jgi:hypothetical protein
VVYISIEMLKMTTTQAEMPLGFMLVGLGRLGFSKYVIARHDVPKQSLCCEPIKAHLKYVYEVKFRYAR